MVPNVILYLLNDLPILVDVDALPGGADRSVRCTNVRTLDGKRPSFVHDKDDTFIFPLSQIRLLEAPKDAGSQERSEQQVSELEVLPPPAPDEEPDEALLARIRQI